MLQSRLAKIGVMSVSAVLFGNALSMAGAAGSRSSVNIDCSSLRVNTDGILSYRSVAAFPEPSLYFSEDLFAKSTRFEGCGYVIISTDNTLSIDAGTPKDLLRIVGDGTYIRIPLVGGNFKEPSGAIVRLDIDALYDINSGKFGFSPYDPDVILERSVSLSPVVAGITDSSSKFVYPLIFDSQLYNYDFASSKGNLVLEIYVKRSRYPFGYDRIDLNIPESRITYFKTHSFSSKPADPAFKMK